MVDVVEKDATNGATMMNVSKTKSVNKAINKVSNIEKYQWRLGYLSDK